MSQLMIWLIGVVGILLLACLILWLATKVERERRGRHTPMHLNSFTSGPVGEDIYKAQDDRRRSRTEARDEK